MTVSEEWKSWSTCTETSNPTPSSIGEAEEYIQSFCSICPVTYECKVSAEGRDLYWSVRGGLIPTRFLERDNMPAIRRPLREPKAYEYPPGSLTPKNPYGKNILERGICNKGLHEINSEADITSSMCRRCRNSSVRLGTSTHCKLGHEKTEANGRMISVGQPGQRWLCNLCPKGNHVPPTHCSNGHEYTEDNSVFHRTKRGRRRRCLTCKRATDAKAKAKQRAKVLAS